MDETTPWHARDVADIERSLQTGGYGLTSAEAAARLSHFGPNRLRQRPRTPLLLVAVRQFLSPLIFIMFVAMVVTLVVGTYLDAGVIAVALALNAIVGVTQERKAENTVQALMRLVVPRARLVRDGREQEIDSARLVPGDLVVVEAGSRVPADLRLISASLVKIDESLLTGESATVTKNVEPVPASAALGDRRSMAYMGTIVSSGRGLGIVVATGERTELGAIAGLIKSGEPARTPIQDRLDRFAKIIGAAVVAISGVAFVSGIALGRSVAEMFRIAVALAVATVPEGLPVAVTITFAIGVGRMARRHAIIRRLPAVETLGSTTVIGSDKTGTLTENRMSVLELWVAGRRYRIEGGTPDGEIVDDEDVPAAIEGSRALHLTLLTGVLTNAADVYRTEEGLHATGDPTEIALLTSAMTAGMEPSEVRAAYSTDVDVPFDPARRLSASVRDRHGDRALYVKGAPEKLIAMCARTLTDGDETGPFDAGAVTAAASDQAARGLRVLAFAYRPLPCRTHPPPLDQDPDDLVFCGLQAMADPPRAGVRDAIAACHEAGIRVIMITGDHADTAAAIGRQLGISSPDGAVLDGSRLRRLSDDELRAASRDTSVFARVAPEQKLRIVTCLQDMGHVVAVTGDGVNDAPALRAAQIGVAMGRDGTDVAREAADMVLADDNFESIVAAVEEGRVTFDNVRKVTFFLISTAIGLVAAILVGLWLRWPLLMLPAQLLWLNLVTSGLQDLALAFEPGEHGVLRRTPRRRSEGIMSPIVWERALIAGAVMAVGTLRLFRWELTMGGSLHRAQTVALSTMVVFQAFQVGNTRSEWRSIFRISPFANRFLFLATAAALGVHVTALYLPVTQYVLRVEPIELQAWLRIVAVAASVIVAMELHKALRRRAGRRGRFDGPEAAAR
ncbi:cation-translocating P-type ATPase [Actinoallomurus acaciae]|uniref:Cation-translocating P-type ATPase n=1 Tax=Actinoallomurus acaciae TaxID=502577 RepID=A0ABV5YMB4_9ACTN